MGLPYRAALDTPQEWNSFRSWLQELWDFAASLPYFEHARGPWLTSTAYDSNDYVTQGGTTYVAMTNHISGPSFASDLAAGKWLTFNSSAFTEMTAAAVAAAAAAQNFANAALIQSGVYATEAAGRAAVLDGVAFKVQGAGDIAAFEYRRVNAGTFSTLIATYPSKAAVDATASKVNGITKFTEVDRYTTATNSPGYRHKDDGHYVPAPAWVCIVVAYDAKHEYRYTATGNSSLVGLVVALNASSNWIATVDNNASAAGKLIDHSVMPAGTASLAFSAIAANAHSVLERNFSVELGAMGDIPSKIDANAANVALMLKTGAQIDYATQPNTRPGFLNQSGVFQANPNWKLTDRVEWSEAAVFLFTGFGHVENVASVEMFNDADQPIGVLYATGVQVTNVLISSALPGWNPACSGVRACGAISGSYLFAFKVTRRNIDESLLPSIRTMKADIVALEAAAPTSVRMLAPTEVYGRVGETLYLYARQIVQDPSLDLSWNLQETNDAVAAITPTSTADIPLILQGMGRDGPAIELASFKVKVSPSVLVSPAIPQNFIFGPGDSLTDSVANADMSGAMPNEVCRRLTGTGRDILPPGPASYGLSNIFFRGTRTGPGGAGLPPIEAVRHEGRPGWSIDDYLTKQVGPNGLNNGFWDVAAGQFSINYYLAQNAFDSASISSGVLPDGSNLTFLPLLGWNGLYSASATALAARMGNLIDRIKAEKPLARFILIGLNPPPKLNRKAFTDGRYVSPAQIFQKAIVELGTAYRALAETKTNVTFLQISQQFDPEVSYRRASFPTRARSPASTETPPFVSSSVSMATDHVHPNVVGYSLMADVITQAIAWANCRGA